MYIASHFHSARFTYTETSALQGFFQQSWWLYKRQKIGKNYLCDGDGWGVVTVGFIDRRYPSEISYAPQSI